jgi:hypothetical protein
MFPPTSCYKAQRLAVASSQTHSPEKNASPVDHHVNNARARRKWSYAAATTFKMECQVRIKARTAEEVSHVLKRAMKVSIDG